MRARLLGTIASLALIGCSSDDGGSAGSASDSNSGSTGASASTSASASASNSASNSESNTDGGSASNSAGSSSSAGETESSTSMGASDSSPSTTGASNSDSNSASNSASNSDSNSGTDTEATGSTTDLPPGVCGDGVLNAGEECDDGVDNAPNGSCREDCTLAVCGDGIHAPSEECDLGVMNGEESGCSEQCVILPSSCGEQSAEAKLIPKPVDIIILIDNSGSMSAEIAGVEKNINQNFAQIIEQSGLDYRVIMVSAYGKSTSNRVCIEAPLGGIPAGGCVNPPAQPVNNPGKFYHYSVSIGSLDSWCKALATYDGATKDQFNLAPMGWRTWLRDDAFKVFIEITDDRVSCSYAGKTYNDNNTIAGGETAANLFDGSLLAKSPLHFGASPLTRNYSWYSIVGLAYNNPPDQAYTPKDPIITAKCPSAVNGGIGYQTLSNMSGGLRNPLCDTTKYNALFQGIANSVVADAKLQCDFDIPTPPMDKILDMDSILVEYTPDGQIDPIVFKKVPSPDQCNATSFYVENGKVILCPQACTSIQGAGAKLEVNFTCEPLKPN